MIIYNEFTNDTRLWLPYGYIIFWKSLHKYYIGVEYKTSDRMGKSAHPNNIWKTYFTSSKIVKDYTLKYGEPDIIRVVKTFETKEECLVWEESILNRVNAATNKKWLNRACTPKGFRCKFHTEETKMKISKTLKSIKNRNSKKQRETVRQLGLKPRTKEQIEKSRIGLLKFHRLNPGIFKGKPCSDYAKQVASRVHKGKTITEEHKLACMIKLGTAITDDTNIFPSLRAAARHYNTDHKKIANFIKHGVDSWKRYNSP